MLKMKVFTDSLSKKISAQIMMKNSFHKCCPITDVYESFEKKYIRRNLQKKKKIRTY